MIYKSFKKLSVLLLYFAQVMILYTKDKKKSKKCHSKNHLPSLLIHDTVNEERYGNVYVVFQTVPKWRISMGKKVRQFLWA